jgi:hypothetical protein
MNKIIFCCFLTLLTLNISASESCKQLEGIYSNSNQTLLVKYDENKSSISLIYSDHQNQSMSINYSTDGQLHSGDGTRTGNKYTATCESNALITVEYYDMGILNHQWLLETSSINEYGSLNGSAKLLMGTWNKKD